MSELNPAASAARRPRRGLRAGLAGLAALALAGAGIAVADPFGWRATSSPTSVADVLP